VLQALPNMKGKSGHDGAAGRIGAEGRARKSRLRPPVTGTGKTTWVSRQIRAAAQKHGSDGVLVSSFTKAAAVELAGRDLPLAKGCVGTLALARLPRARAQDIAEKHLRDWNHEHPRLALSKGGSVDMDDPFGESEQSRTARARGTII